MSQGAPVHPINAPQTQQDAQPEAQQAAANPFAVLLQLEADTRQAESVKALQFLMANDTRRLVDFRQAVVLSGGGRRMRVEAVSSLGVVERGAPAIRWLEKTASVVQTACPTDEVSVVTPAALPKGLGEDWKHYSFQFAAWCPLRAMSGELLGGLWLTRSQPWTEADLTLLERLRDAYAYAWSALAGGRRRRPILRKGLLYALSLAVLVALAFVPIRMTALAPAEIVATEPIVVAAPLAGTIETVEVSPNARVEAGQVLFRFEDTELSNEARVSERRLEVARAELAKARQGAFNDPRSLSDIAILESEAKLREVELAHARAMLNRSVVVAQSAGIAQFTDRADWIGRPVSLGERVMRIADPNQVHLRVDMPVDDAIVIESQAPVDVFLDIAPLEPLKATLESASYEARINDQELLVFRVDAQLSKSEQLPRIGLKGTAKVYGPQTRLFMYLFRRPLSAARQYLGL